VIRLTKPFIRNRRRVASASEVEIGERNGRVISDSIMKGALKFIAKQPMIVLGSVDPEKNIWASLLFGTPGFVKAPDDRKLEINLAQDSINEFDPFWTNIQTHPKVGALLLELATRRRLRINGLVNRITSNQLLLEVQESYPNCPKYIQRRNIQFGSIEASGENLPALEGEKLASDQLNLITKADLFFVASAHPERGVDVSHRGGLPGFVEPIDDSTLRIPDYSGNSMFNTLGNFAINPKAGLVFLDFDRNRMLQLTGSTEVQWNQKDGMGQTGGTKRFWIFKLNQWRESAMHAGVKWEFVDYSPHNPNLNSDVPKE